MTDNIIKKAKELVENGIEIREAVYKAIHLAATYEQLGLIYSLYGMTEADLINDIVNKMNEDTEVIDGV